MPLLVLVIHPLQTAIFKNVAQSLEPGETPSNKLCTKFLHVANNDEIMSKNKFTGTATQPQCHRKFCQFNNDQYCRYLWPKTAFDAKITLNV